LQRAAHGAFQLDEQLRHAETVALLSAFTALAAFAFLAALALRTCVTWVAFLAALALRTCVTWVAFLAALALRTNLAALALWACVTWVALFAALAHARDSNKRGDVIAELLHAGIEVRLDRIEDRLGQ